MRKLPIFLTKRPKFLRIFLMAELTARELIRERILWLSLLFAFIMLICSFFISILSIQSPGKILFDLGTTAIFLSSSFIGIVFGCSLINKEKRDRTIYSLLVKPVSRHDYFVAKWFGVFAVVVGNILAMNIILTIAVLVLGAKIYPIQFILEITYTILEAGILISLGMMFSTRSSSFLSGVFTVSFWAIGHSLSQLYLTLDKVQAFGFVGLVRGALKIIPQLQWFEFIQGASYGAPVQFSHAIFILAYFVIYTALVLSIGCVFFKRSDL